MPTTFTVHGPYQVPFISGAAAKIVNKATAKQFWEWWPQRAKDRGCYIFAMGNKGLTPGYVGQATKSFKQEAFTADKLHKYQQFLADFKVGQPVMFFVTAPRKAGKPNAKHITQLEDFLIQAALSANPKLLNIKGTKQEAWSIAGVLRAGQGKTSTAAKKLKHSLKL